MRTFDKVCFPAHKAVLHSVLPFFKRVLKQSDFLVTFDLFFDGT